VIITFRTSGTKHSTKVPFPFLAGRDGYVFTAPVAHFKPNAFGLYDMLGNAREWCADYYGSSYFSESPTDDPLGPGGGTKRVARGGGFGSPPFDMRSSDRLGLAPSTRRFSQGFRVVSEVTTSFDVQLPIILISGL
jgi:formylglycine-generating enzyme required for sulfatase activity